MTPISLANYEPWKAQIQPSIHEAHVLVLEFNRANKLNAFSKAQWQAYRACIDTASSDDAVRCIVMFGAGEHFSAGIDLADLQAPQESDPYYAANALQAFIADFQDAISSTKRCRKPVIMVAHGVSYGLAIDILTAADIRLSAPAKFSVKEVDAGLAADMGTLQRLQYCVGSDTWIREVCLTCRIFDEKEAARTGFVHSVYESKAAAVRAATAMASLIAAKSPVAVQSTKALLNHAQGRTEAEGLAFTAHWNAVALQSGEFRERVRQAMRKMSKM